MDRIKFDPKEMEVVKTYLPDAFGRPGSEKLNTPVSSVDNFLAAARGEGPLWIPHAREMLIFNHLPHIQAGIAARKEMSSVCYINVISKYILKCEL